MKTLLATLDPDECPTCNKPGRPETTGRDTGNLRCPNGHVWRDPYESAAIGWNLDRPYVR